MIDFIESFDGFGAYEAGMAGLAAKGWAPTGGTQRAGVASGGRFGNGLLVAEFYGAGYVYKTFSMSAQRLWLGFAVSTWSLGHLT